MTAPPAANAPIRPYIRPLISGVLRANLTPSENMVSQLGPRPPPPCAAGGSFGAAGQLGDAGGDDDGRGQVQQAVDDDDDLRHTQLGARVVPQAQRRTQARDHGEQAGRADHGHAVGHHQPELVGGLHLVLAAQQVRDRGVLRRDPHHRRAADQEVRREQPPPRADQRDGQEQPAADQVHGHHHPAPVQPVGQHATEWGEQQAGQQLGEHDGTEREALHEVAGDQLVGQAGQREQGQPVGGGQQERDAPQPAERTDGQDAADAVGGGRARIGCA